PTLSEIGNWWSNGQQNGVAIVCGQVSGIVVLDIDDPDKFGVALNAIGETLPDTPIVRTRKGWHVYFKYPQNRIVRRHVRLSDWGAELRGDGCYVVAPPTKIDGHRYYWAKRNGKLLALGQVPLADCPEWLLDAFGVPLADQPERHELKTQQSPKPSQQTLTPEQRNAIKAVLLPHWHEGVRHELALGLAGLLAKSGFTQDEALELLREIAAEAQDNEWRDRERALKDSFDRLWRGEQVIGFKRLEDILGEQTAKVIASIVSPRKGTNGKANATVELLTLSEWNGRLAHITQGQWLVDGLLRPSWLFILNARPKVGKSIVAVNLATALANGTPFLNQQTNPCAVVYIDLERPIETLNRFKVLGALDNPNIFVPAERVGADLLDTLRDLIRQAKDRTNRPVVVFVDTLGDFIKPALRQRKASINDYDAIADILQFVRDLALETGCAFVFVHHLRKAQSDEPSEVDVLGSTAIAGKFDVIAHLHPDRTDASVLSLVAEENAIAKTVLHFEIRDNLNLALCDAPPKTKEEHAAKVILNYLERHKIATRQDLIRHLIKVGLANPPAEGKPPKAAETLLHRAMFYLQGKVIQATVGRSVVYKLQRTLNENHEAEGLPSSLHPIECEGDGGNRSDDLHDLHHLQPLREGSEGSEGDEGVRSDGLPSRPSTPIYEGDEGNPEGIVSEGLAKTACESQNPANFNVDLPPSLCCREPLTPDNEGLAVCVGCGRLWRFVDGSWRPEFPDFDGDNDPKGSPDPPEIATLNAKNSRAQKAAMKTKLEKALQELSIALNALERVCSDMKRKAKKQKHVENSAIWCLNSLWLLKRKQQAPFGFTVLGSNNKH
ncbi:Bifunctional DNA primase/polymerase, N-terminal, partial [Candidatus Fervidibacteria bacterium JGI MDM2 SSWTFF-3-K9]